MKRILPILAAAMAAAGILILSWPVLAEFLTACTQDEIIAGYDSGLAGADRERIEKEMEAALRYNEKLSDGTGAPAFSSEEKDPAYDRLLENSDGVMCVVEIPKLSVRLPVYHGTSDEALKKGAGHLYGSSLPVGGPSSHAVIAAHTALPGEELFTHIDELETGDLFRIRVLGQIHFYRVDRIRVVLPEETDDLRIEEGKDFVTLYTCTPYGINTHRLLVRGVRDQDAENAEQNQPDAVTELNDGKGETVKKFLKLGISAVLMMLMTAMVRAKEIQKEQDEKEAGQVKAKERFDQKCARRNLSVDENTIASVVSDWTKIPVARLEEAESKRLSKLEAVLHKRIIGQEEAVTAVASAVKRGRVGLKDPKRPIGSFLFLGPTGVGKTELSKALAEAVFGSEQSMIRVDMSEYMEKHSVSKMIGSPPGYVGYDEAGQLSEQVRRHPYSVVLFDEIEKAHPDVFNILLQVLDEGHITDAHGHKVDFKNTCIIMTSNVGAQAIVDPKKLGFGAKDDAAKDYERMKDGVMTEVKRLFRPEFLNRIDEILVFHPLSPAEVEKIVDLLLKDLVKRAKEQLSIKLTIAPAVRKYIAETGFSEKFGARPLKREIQTKIEDEVSELVLKGEAHA